MANIKSAVVISDLHVPFHDTNSLASLCKFLNDFQPNYLIINGDLYDFYGISRFGKNPARTLGGLQKELDIGFIVLQWLLSYIPNTKVILVEGNHEERWDRYLSSDKNLLSLKSMKLEDNMRLDELGIEYKKIDYTLYGLTISHGVKYGVHAAYQEIGARGISGISGHIHRAQMTCKTFADRQLVWVSTGHLCDESQVDYTKPGKQVINHQQGFAVCYYNHTKDITQVYPIVINNHSFIFNGILYEPQKRYLARYDYLYNGLPDISSYLR